MAAAQVDANALARGLSLDAAGGSKGSSNAQTGENSQSVRRKNKTPALKIRKTRPRRAAAKRRCLEISNTSEESVREQIRETDNRNLEQQQVPVTIPCRAGCPLVFGTVQEADTHVRQAHGAPRVDQLILQPGSFQNVSNSSPISPSPIIPNRCNHCQQFFATKSDLDSHIHRKHNQSALVCPFPGCHFQNSDQPSLISHILDSHSQTNSQLPGSNMQVQNPVHDSSLPVSMSRLSLNQPLASLAAPPSLVQASGYTNPHAQFSHFGGNWSQAAKSGLDRTSNSRARVFVNWPHECIDEILAKRSFAYKELSGSALAAGSIASLFRSPEFYQCPESIQVYMQHLSFIFHCLSYSNNIEAVLDFHASILSQVEAGLLTWSARHDQTFTLQRLNFWAGLRDIPVFTQSSSGSGLKTSNKVEDPEEAKRKKDANKNICKDFNSGSCPQPGDYDG